MESMTDEDAAGRRAGAAPAAGAPAPVATMPAATGAAADGAPAAAEAPNAALLAHVRATADLLALPLDEARIQRVAQNLQRTAALAALLDGVPLAPHDELAEIYCPAPFRSAADPLEAP
jgi:hypothetical protein